MNNPLFDLVGRQLLLRMGFTPKQIEASLKAMRVQKTAPKPPASGSIVPKGQTNLFTQSGKLRNFTKPNPLAPTLSPVANVNRAVLQPGPVRPPAPGQLSLFGLNPSAKPSGQFTAPKVPAPGSGVIKASKDALNWLTEQKSGQEALKRALRANTLGKTITPGKGGATASILALANYLQDLHLAKNDPETYQLKQANLVGTDMNVTREDIRKANLSKQAPTPAQLLSQAQVEGLTMPGGMFYMGGNGKRTLSQGTPAAPQPAVVTEPTPQMQYVPPTPQRKAPKPKPSKPIEQAYGASGKGLYMAHKKNNPLMIRYFGKNYGSAKTEA